MPRLCFEPPLQLDSVPRDPTDQPLSVIATPTQTIRIERPSRELAGFVWAIARRVLRAAG
jgi:hypothetical protein